MGIKALKLDAVRPFISASEERKDGKLVDEANATIWEIGTLDSRIAGRIRDMATTVSVDPNAPDEDVNTQINLAEVNYQTVMFGLKGWKNFRDADGNDIPFRTKSRTFSGGTYRVVDPDLMKLIPMHVIDELAAEIKKDNEVSAADAKK